MAVIENKTFAELSVGDHAELVRVCTEDDFLVFANASGNHNPMHFSLARGPGNQLFTSYSKSSEKYAKLYSRVFDQGVAVTKEKTLGADQADAFTGVNGLRSSQADTTLFAAVSGATKQAPHGRIAIVVLRLPIRSFWR